VNRHTGRRTEPLTVDTIVDAACALIADAGLDALSMRRLGAALGVDPMAVYHHVANKRELLAMELAPGDDPWEVRLRAWAVAYWEVVVANRDLVAAGLADPVVAAGGTPLIAPLVRAVADSGLERALVEPNAWLVVDFVHGAGLGAAAPLRHRDHELGQLLEAFQAGLDTVVAGIAARATAPR
jgi:TetR/AcrR family tetracycline transcriptional repressor